ncbi:MAG: hypothetical protein Q9170_002369 [Blastenia crenularia]
MNRVQKRNFDKHRHAFRVTHVKTQGIVKGPLLSYQDFLRTSLKASSPTQEPIQSAHVTPMSPYSYNQILHPVLEGLA